MPEGKEGFERLDVSIRSLWVLEAAPGAPSISFVLRDADVEFATVSIRKRRHSLRELPGGDLLRLQVGEMTFGDRKDPISLLLRDLLCRE
jgi:hypothetical protein